MKRSLHWLMAGACVTVLCMCCRNPLPPYAGSVRNMQTGHPVAGAVVVLEFDFICPELRLTDGSSGRRPGPSRYTRTDSRGNFHFPAPRTKIPPGCRSLVHTRVFAPGCFPYNGRRPPSMIRLEPMTRYLDHLPWRYPREFMTGNPAGTPSAIYRRWHRRLSIFQAMYTDRDLPPTILDSIRNEWSSRKMHFLGPPGVFWQCEGARFDQVLSLGRSGDILVHCSQTRTWQSLSTRGRPSNDDHPPLPRQTAVLPSWIPMDSGFPMIREGQLFLPRFPADPAAPCSPETHISAPCRYENVSAVAPWGIGAATIENRGRSLCLYSREERSITCTREILATDVSDGDPDTRFAFLLPETNYQPLCLIRRKEEWYIFPLPAPGSSIPPAPPIHLPVTGEIISAALGDGLVVGLADGGLRRVVIDRRRNMSISLDSAFHRFSRGVLPGPALSLAASARYNFVAVCGDDAVYRFGILGIPDCRVRLGKSFNPPGTGRRTEKKSSPRNAPVRIHPHSASGSTGAGPRQRSRINR